MLALNSCRGSFARCLDRDEMGMTHCDRRMTKIRLDSALGEYFRQRSSPEQGIQDPYVLAGCSYRHGQHGFQPRSFQAVADAIAEKLSSSGWTDANKCHLKLLFVKNELCNGSCLGDIGGRCEARHDRDDFRLETTTPGEVSFIVLRHFKPKIDGSKFYGTGEFLTFGCELKVKLKSDYVGN